MGALKDAARKGKGGDTRLGHLSNGDIVFPSEHVNAKNMKVIVDFMQKQGVKDPSRFIVGHASNRKNPKTRLPMFADGDGGGNSDGPGSGAGGADSGGGGAPGSGPGAGAPGGIGDPVGGPTASDPSTGSTTGPAQGPGGLAVGGTDASSAVPGPVGNTQGIGAVDASARAQEAATLGQSSVLSGNMGGFGQPDLGILNGPINGFVTDPLGTIASLGIDGLLGLSGLPGLAAGLVSRGLTGQSIGSNITGLVEGKGLGQGGLSGMTGTPGGINPGSVGPAPPGADTGNGLQALGGGIGVNLDEMLKNRLGGLQ